MELDSLKEIWRDSAPEAPGTRDNRSGNGSGNRGVDHDFYPGRESLLPLLQQRSRGPVARMRRNLRIELLCIIVAYVPLILFYLVEFQGRLRAISLALLLVGGLFCAYYYRKSRLLNNMQCLSCQVRSNLARQVGTLRKYTRFYLLTSTIVIPTMAILTYLIFHFQLFYPDNTKVYHSLSPAPWWKNSTIWLLMLVPFTVAMYYFNVWYINKLYGRHIKKLQELLREMDEE